MPRIPDEPLLKTTLNLYKADVEWYKERYGQGYTEQIRLAIRHAVIREKAYE